MVVVGSETLSVTVRYLFAHGFLDENGVAGHSSDDLSGGGFGVEEGDVLS